MVTIMSYRIINKVLTEVKNICRFENKLAGWSREFVLPATKLHQYKPPVSSEPVTLRMKLFVAQLLFLLVVTVVTGQDSSVKSRVKAQLQQWATVQAHCAEASYTEGSIDSERALECKKCQAGVGDWNTPDGFKRGKACLETWEPKTLEVCGDLFQEYEDSGFDVSYTVKMVECWENTYRRDIASKCLEATGGEDMNLALLCVFKHLTDNHKHAEKVLFGSSDENPMKPSK